jgi:chromosome segregation ATPase
MTAASLSVDDMDERPMSERSSSAADATQDDELERGVEQLVQSVQDRATELAQREARVHELEELLEAQRRRVDQLEQRVQASDEEAVERSRRLDDRERALDVREAEFEAESELRLAKLEQRERYVAELQQRLEAREDQFAAQVGQLQHDLRRRDVAAVAAAARPAAG